MITLRAINNVLRRVGLLLVVGGVPGPDDNRAERQWLTLEIVTVREFSRRCKR